MMRNVQRLAMTLGAFALVATIGSGALAGKDKDKKEKDDKVVLYVDGHRLNLKKLKAILAEEDTKDFDLEQLVFGDPIEVVTRHLKTVEVIVIDMPEAATDAQKKTLERWLKKIDRTTGVVDVGRHDRKRPKRRKRPKDDDEAIDPTANPFTQGIFDGDLERSNVDNQPPMTQIAAPAAQASTTGQGVVVAVLDGGFDLSHEIFVGSLAAVPAYDAFDDDDNVNDLGDGIDNDGDGFVDSVVGHGNFVSSLILAASPDAKILPIRVLDDEGFGTDLALAQGITKAIEAGVGVINLSVVIPDPGDALRLAIGSAALAGIPISTSAGDETEQLFDHPYVRSRTVTVGAVNDADGISPFSPAGQIVDLFAPGEEMQGALAGYGPDGYGWWDGTSFSAPLGASGLAMLIEIDPEATPRELAKQLSHVNCTDPVSGGGPAEAGRLDLVEALVGFGE